MKKISVTKYDKKYYNKWNQLVDESFNGTIFQSLEFLSYHLDKYLKLEHHLIFLKGETLIGVLPAIEEEKKLISPYGASFGGIVTTKQINLNDSEQLITALVDYLKLNEFNSASLVLTPNHLSQLNNQSLEFSLLRHGFNLVSADLFSVIYLSDCYDDIWNNKYLSRNRNTLRKASKSFVIKSHCSLEEFYPILLQDKSRHNSSPTHTLDQLKYIQRKFPDKIWFDVAYKEIEEAVGICYFKLNERSLMTFYMAQTDQSLGKNGKNVLIDYGIRKAIEQGYEIFDFGGSTIGYDIMNPGIAKFKESFGAVGALRKKFIWKNKKTI